MVSTIEPYTTHVGLFQLCCALYIQLVCRYSLVYVRDDGWNAGGQEGGREGNLRPFEDTTGGAVQVERF